MAPNAIVMALMLALTACGGGGGSSGTTSAPASSSAPAAPTSVAPDAAVLVVSERTQFSVTGLPAGGNSSIRWSISGAGCSGTSCGTIDANGMYTAPGIVPGTSTFAVIAADTTSARQLGQANVSVIATDTGLFRPVGDMSVARSQHTATLLGDGKVLIAGGDTTGKGDSTSTSAAELYDPATRAFTATGSMTQMRSRHTATLLNNGKVLITGPAGVTSTEVYDPGTGRFAPGPALLTAQRRFQIATPLPNGKVLVTGGDDAELYDPATSSFAPAAPYAAVNMYYEAAVPLRGGRVLLLGTNPAQIYDPVQNRFTTSGNLISEAGSNVELFTATLLADGRVVITGGTDEMQRFSAIIMFDPSTDAFTLTSGLREIRDAHAAARLMDGRVLVLGGDSMGCGIGCSFSGSLASAELYDPVANTVTATTNNMRVRRTLPQATALANGDILVTGGVSYCGISCFLGAASSAELYRAAPN